MEWREIGNQVAKVAPLLGGLLGGPVGAAAGQIAATFLGTDPTPEAVMKEISSNPDALVTLRKAEMEHKTALEGLRIKEKELEINAQLENRKIDKADVKDARGRDTQLRIAGHHNYRADIMLTLAFAGVLVIIYLLFKHKTDLPTDILTIMNMVLGGLLKCIYDAFQFEFGSSRGSKEKDLR